MSFQSDGRLFQFLRLSFGVTNIVSAFQGVIDNIITDNDIKGSHACLDNVIVVDKTIKEHDGKLARYISVSKCLSILLDNDKCFLSQTSICYLEYKIENNSL